MRAAGIEVWFDLNELRGGDAREVTRAVVAVGGAPGGGVVHRGEEPRDGVVGVARGARGRAHAVPSP